MAVIFYKETDQKHIDAVGVVLYNFLSFRAELQATSENLFFAG